MPAAQLAPDKDPFRLDRFRPVETRNYNQWTDELRDNWLQGLQRSTFLTIRYGLIDAEGTLERISNMQKDWDSYGGDPPSINAIQASKEILEELAGALILPSTIVPSAGGGVSIYFMTDQRTVYIESYNQGSQALVMYDRHGNAEVLEIDRDISRSEVSARILTYLG
jgi:hypothetical protein